LKLTLFVNHRCNLRCTYCYTGEKFDRPMPLEVAKRAVELGLDDARGGFVLVSFFGGEPLLETPLLEAIVEHTKARGAARGVRIFFGLATNGTLLGERRLRLLRENDFIVQLSLDGLRAAQDATRRFARGRSSSAVVEKNLRTLLGTSLFLRVLSVVDPANVAHLGASFDHFMDLGARRIQFSPNYSAPWDDRACALFEEALSDLGSRYMARLRGGDDVRLDPINGKIVTHLAKGYQPKDLCQFGEGEIAVAPSGRIYPCDRLVGEDTNEEVCIGHLDRGIDGEKRDHLVRAKNAPDPECAACEHRPRCMHWCGCANYETTRSVGGVSPVVCWFERTFIAEADRVANTLFSERNPTFLRRFYVPDLPL
jgi:uncharacterized protein